MVTTTFGQRHFLTNSVLVFFRAFTPVLTIFLKFSNAIAQVPTAENFSSAEVTMISAASLTQEAIQTLNRHHPGWQSTLPFHRVELEFDPADWRLRGKAHLTLRPPEKSKKLFLKVGALREGATDFKIQNAKLNDSPISIHNHGQGILSLLLDSAISPSLKTNAINAEDRPPTAAKFLDLTFTFSLKLSSVQVICPTNKNSNSNSKKQTTNNDESYLLAGVFPEVTRPYSDGNFPAIHPRKMEPLFGELANYAVTILAPPSLKFAGTGAEIGRFPAKDGRIKTTRIALAVRGFALAAGTNRREINFSAQKSTSKPSPQLRILAPNNVNFEPDAQVLRRVLAHHSNNLFPYPWTTFDLAWAPLPDDLKAAAYPNALFLRQNRFDDTVESAARHILPNFPDYQAADDAHLIAREVSHQWFRGILGSDAMAEPFLDEGIALQLACQFSKYDGPAKGATQRWEKCHHLYQVGAYRNFRTTGGKDAPLQTPLNNLADQSTFQALAGAKSAVMLERLKAAIGAKKYDRFLSSLMKKKAFLEVTGAEFFSFLIKKTPPAKSKELKNIIARFMEETQGDADIGGSFSPDDITKLSGLPTEFQEFTRDFIDAMTTGTLDLISNASHSTTKPTKHTGVLPKVSQNQSTAP